VLRGEGAAATGSVGKKAIILPQQRKVRTISRAGRDGKTEKKLGSGVEEENCAGMGAPEPRAARRRRRFRRGR